MGNDKRKNQFNYRKGISSQTNHIFQKKQKEDCVICKGKVIESYPNTRFLVELDNNGNKINATLAGKLRQNYIKVLPGDKVELEISVYDLTQGRISRRL